MLFTRRNFVRLLASVAGNFGLSHGRAVAQDSGSAAGSVSGTTNPSSTLWLKQPSVVWMDAFPIGNGRMGAMVFGGIKSERLALNEDTLWSGFPRDCNNPDAKNHLPVVRKMVLQDKDYHAADLECLKMQGPWNEAYQPLGDLIVDLDHGTDATSYVRSLDLDSAVSAVSYRVDGVLYQREVFASFPDDVIVFRLTSSKPGALTGTFRFKSQLQSKSKAEGKMIVLSGKAPKRSLPNYINKEPTVVYSDIDGEGMHFASVAQLEAPGGRIEPQPDGSARVLGASSIVVLIGCATGFSNYAVAPDLPLNEVIAKAQAAVSRAAAKSYEQLSRTHTDDHRKLFRRVSLDLPSSADAGLATDQRVEAFGKNPDPSLAVLLFNFGRYLLIASSRPGSQPANLQGIWSADLRPPWSCNWTTNINTQMNYWPAETCNLSECHLPLVAMVQDLSVNGAKTAEVNYGTPGWCSHHNVDLWRQSAPVGDGQAWTKPTWASWCMSGQWLCAHLWDHYTFTQDKQYLRDVAYPVMRGSAEFCAGWLIDDGSGGLTTCPSVSPENEFLAPDGKVADVSAGTTMDMALTREIFAHCIEASTILDVDPEFRSKLNSLTKRLPPYKVGSLGQLLEWSPGLEGSSPGTGHMSPLYPVYPGTQITPQRTPELAAAARKLLERRMEFHVRNAKAPYAGWPGAWVNALWARLGDGNNAWELVKAQLNHDANCNLFNDCFDTHPASLGGARRPTPGVLFQIDGNLGVTGAIAEMLLQSHDGEIAFLPALPDAWGRGSVKGLKARGGLEVSIEWPHANASTATVHAFTEKTYRFRAPKGQELKQILQISGSRKQQLRQAAGDRHTFSFHFHSGEVYQFSFADA